MDGTDIFKAYKVFVSKIITNFNNLIQHKSLNYIILHIYYLILILINLLTKNG